MYYFTMLPKQDILTLEDPHLTLIDELLPKSEILYGNKDVLRFDYHEKDSIIRLHLLCEERDGVVNVESRYRFLQSGSLTVEDVKQKVTELTDKLITLLQEHSSHRLKFVTGMWELQESESQPF